MLPRNHPDGMHIAFDDLTDPSKRPFSWALECFCGGTPNHHNAGNLAGDSKQAMPCHRRSGHGRAANQ